MVVSSFRSLFTVALCLTEVAIGVKAQTGAGNEWTTPGGTLEGTRFSTLQKITATNVGSIKEEFSFSTGVNGYMEGQPLVVGSTMYVVGPFPYRLFALDLTNPGHTRWVFTPQVNQFSFSQGCCGQANRGAAYSSSSSNSSSHDLVIYATLDDQVIAVNAGTGAQVWQVRMGSPRTGETMTGATFVVDSNGKDIVIVGNAGAEEGVRGWVAALDAGTGAKLWQFYNTGTDTDVGIDSSFAPYYAKDRGTNLGATTWPGTLYQHGGAVVWNWFTYDPIDDLLFYGTAQPAPWDAEMRVNPSGSSDNKWSSTIFARNPGTGKAAWAYQVTSHDNWDFDSISESIVATLPHFNGGAPFLAHFDKNGYGYTIDAKTGKVLVAKPFIPSLNWSTGVNLSTGEPALVPGKQTSEGKVVPSVCPSPLGGKNFHPAAFSPMTGLFYVPANNTCTNFEALKVNYIQGAPFVGAHLSFAASPDVATFGSGRLIAWDPTTGKEKWGIKENYPYVSGVLATQGNLVLYGTVDGYFKALNATTGQVLFAKQYSAPISGNIITFIGADGNQRIAFYTGQPGRSVKGLPPSPATFKPSTGTVHVFKLP